MIDDIPVNEEGLRIAMQIRREMNEAEGNI